MFSLSLVDNCGLLRQEEIFRAYIKFFIIAELVLIIYYFVNNAAKCFPSFYIVHVRAAEFYYFTNFMVAEVQSF